MLNPILSIYLRSACC